MLYASDMNDYYKRVIKRFLSLLDQELLVRDKILVEEVKLLLLQSFMEADKED